MKTKNKKSIFKRLSGFIDKKIIMPITRFVYNVWKLFNRSEKSIESWFSRPNVLLVISLIIAILAFVAIDQKKISFTSQTAEVLKNQKIEVNYNEEAYVVEGLPKKVDITLMGNRSDLFIAKQSTSSKVTVDLSGLKPGTHKVNIEYSQPLSTIDYSVNPSIASVTIYPKVSETKTLTTDLFNQDNLNSKLVIESATPEISEVVIKGAEDEKAKNSLTKVATVKALVDLDSLSTQEEGTTTIKDVPLKAYDSKGKALNVEIVPSKVNVELNIKSPSKTVPIKVVTTGELGFGKAISNIDMSEQTVTVYGTEEALEKLEYVPLEVDVTGLKGDKDYKMNLTKPKGVRSMAVNNVTLNFTLGDSSDTDIKDVNIDVRNLDDKYSVQGLTENDIKVTVNVKGVASVLKGIEASDITAYIDLEGYAPGEYEVPVMVEGTDSRVQYLSKTKKVKIKVVEK